MEALSLVLLAVAVIACFFIRSRQKAEAVRDEYYRQCRRKREVERRGKSLAAELFWRQQHGDR